MKTMPYTQISREALPPRVTVLGFVKVGGLEDRVRFTKYGKPWVAPVRYTDPVRFEVTTREQRIEEVQGQGKNAGEKFKVGRGYVRDTAFHKKIADDLPSELDVRFMFPTAAQNFICHFGAHDGKRWVCQGNGIEASDVARGDGIPCPCPRLKQFEGAYKGPALPEGTARPTPCKPRGVLSFILPDAETFGGFHVFKTTSYESIANLRTQLEVFENQFGRLDGIPFRLKVYPATKSYDDGAGTTTQPIVTLVIAATFDTARMIGEKAAEESRRFLLAAGGAPDPVHHRTILEREMVEEAEAEGQEFHPPEPEPKTEAGQTPLEDLGAKIRERAQQQRGPLPVVQAQPANGNGKHEPEEPDFEVVEDESPFAEQAAELRALLQEHGARLAPNHLERLQGMADSPDEEITAGLDWLKGLLKGPAPKPAPSPEEEAEEEEEPAGPASAKPGPLIPPTPPAKAEPVGSLTGKPRSVLRDEYVEAIARAKPEWDAMGRRPWQASRIGKSNMDTWEPDDFELALQLVKRNDFAIGDAVQATMPGLG